MSSPDTGPIVLAGNRAEPWPPTRASLREAQWVGREAALIAITLGIYKLVANAAPRNAERAQRNGAELLRLEQALRLDVEHGGNDLVGAHPALALAAQAYYVVMHVVAPSMVLVLLLLRAPRRYPPLRNVLISSSVLGLVVFWLAPVAPPRLLPGAGYVDIGAQVAFLGTGGHNGITDAENPFAAMPSLHIVWAVWAAAGVFVLCRGSWPRALAGLHVLLTAVVIVVTANHYLLDAVAGLLAFGLGVAITSLPSILRRCSRSSPAGRGT